MRLKAPEGVATTRGPPGGARRRRRLRSYWSSRRGRTGAITMRRRSSRFGLRSRGAGDHRGPLGVMATGRRRMTTKTTMTTTTTTTMMTMLRYPKEGHQHAPSPAVGWALALAVPSCKDLREGAPDPFPVLCHRAPGSLVRRPAPAWQHVHPSHTHLREDSVLWQFRSRSKHFSWWCIGLFL